MELHPLQLQPSQHDGYQKRPPKAVQVIRSVHSSTPTEGNTASLLHNSAARQDVEALIGHQARRSDFRALPIRWQCAFTRIGKPAEPAQSDCIEIGGADDSRHST